MRNRAGVIPVFSLLCNLPLCSFACLRSVLGLVVINRAMEYYLRASQMIVRLVYNIYKIHRHPPLSQNVK